MRTFQDSTWDSRAQSGQYPDFGTGLNEPPGTRTSLRKEALLKKGGRVVSLAGAAPFLLVNVMLTDNNLRIFVWSNA